MDTPFNSPSPVARHPAGSDGLWPHADGALDVPNTSMLPEADSVAAAARREAAELLEPALSGPDALRNTLRDKPLLAIATAVAVGVGLLVLARLFPRFSSQRRSS